MYVRVCVYVCVWERGFTQQEIKIRAAINYEMYIFILCVIATVVFVILQIKKYF